MVQGLLPEVSEVLPEVPASPEEVRPEVVEAELFSPEV